MSNRFPYWRDPGDKRQTSPLSSFPRPTPVRQTLQTQASAVAEPAITTEEELLAAIANAPYGETPSCYGRAVVIAGDIVITRTIDLSDSRFSGLRITSVSRSRLIPATTMHGEPLFRFGDLGDDIQVDSLTIYGETGRRFSTVSILSTLCSRLTLADLVWNADALHEGSTAQTFAFRFTGNRRVGGSTAGGITGRLDRSIIAHNINDAALPITLSPVSLRTSISNNVLLGDVTLSAFCQSCSITGNVDVGNIDTSASSGLNVIDGNTSCGTITPRTGVNGDALGLNT